MANAKPAGATSKKPEVKDIEDQTPEKVTPEAEAPEVAEPIPAGRKLANGTVRTDH